MRQSAQANRPVFRLPAAKLHLALATGFSSRGATEDIFNAFEASGYLRFYHYNYSDYWVWSLSAEYNLSGHVRLGLTMHKMPGLEVGDYFEFEQVGGTSYNLFVQYVPWPAAPLFFSRWEVALGAGLNYSMVTVKDSFTLFEFIPTTVIKKNIMGGYWQGSLDYYVIKSLSLQLKYAGVIMQTLSVPEISQQTVQGVPKLKPHRLGLNAYEASLGVRLHF